MQKRSETTITKSEQGRAEKVDTPERSLFGQILRDHGVPGVIAVGVIGTICFIAIHQVATRQPVEIPKYFTEISSLIIGYYFGTHTHKQKDSPKDA